MKINNWKHLSWFVFVLLATIAACILYVANFHSQLLPVWVYVPSWLIQKPIEHHTVGGTPLGLAYGAISLAIFIFAALLNLRKKFPLLKVGLVQRWLRAHIWLTFLTIPLVILHSGFRLGGQMTTLLMVLYAIVMVSGIYGLILQHHMPQLMKERLPAETVYEQIPHVRSQLCLAAEEMRDSLRPRALKGRVRGRMLAAGGGGTGVAEAVEPSADLESQATLLDFLDREILPYLKARRGERFRLGNARFSDDTFRLVKLRVAESYRNQVVEIQEWCDQRRLLDLQIRLQHWLHGWLFVHVPFSFLLLLLTIWHACVTLFYY